MKSLFKLAAAAPAIALISACATTAPTTPPPSASGNQMPDAAYDRMMPERYTCADDGQIMAKQSINKQQAQLTVTLPKLNWSQQPITLAGGVKGTTASYVNDSNPEIIYAWHMQDNNTGLLAMKWANGEEYQVACKKL